MLSAIVIAAAFYGLDFDPASTNSPTDSRIYPVSPVSYRMVQPDGTARLFDLADAEQGVLSGPKPWLGVVKDRRIDVWADPQYTGGKLRTAFTFVAGRLRLMVLDGKKYAFAQPGSPADDLAALFPEQKLRSYEKGSGADTWRNDGSRLRLWFSNPNCAGMLLAEILLVLVWLLFLVRGPVRIAVGFLAAAAAYGLLATGSRGALAGAVVGLLALAAAFAKKLFTRRGVLILLSGLFVLVAGLVVSGNAGRVVNTFRSLDPGNMRRLKVGEAAVKMFSDAPLGWKGGEVPGRNACLNWYVFDESHIVRTHVMSMAECGWFAGWFYVLLWALALVAGLVLAMKGRPLMAALWLSFGLAGCFNPVYKDWELWFLPLASLLGLAAPGGRLSARQWCVSALVAAVLSAVAVVGLVVAGKMMQRPTKIAVRPSGKATLVNGSSPRVWIVGDPLVMAGGGFPGREILSYYTQHPDAAASAYVYSVDDLPAEAESVIVAGRNVSDYLAAYAEGRACKAANLLLLSPSVGPDAVPAQLLGESKLLWIAGTLLAAHHPAYATARDWMKLVPGCERYVPIWTNFIPRNKKDL